MQYRGVNIGGFFSQNDDFSDSKLDSFFTENDIQKIAQWGMNLIRLPVDYPFFESDDKPYVYMEERIKRIETVIDWAYKAGIAVLFELHNVQGYTFEPGKQDKNDLWDKNSENRKRFLASWDFFSRRFNKFDIIYEILNEPVTSDDNWHELAEETIAVIRKNDTKNQIMIESNKWGRCDTFATLKKFDDDRIIYSFHFYEPMLVTHQHADWCPFFTTYDKAVEYPGAPKGYTDQVRLESIKINESFGYFLRHEDTWQDKNSLKKILQPVLDFQKKHDVPVFCGEFGCIVRAEPGIRQRWLKDVIDLFDENGISFAYWSYKNMDFGLYDFTQQYAGNPNYNPERLDKKSLEILMPGLFK